MACETAAPLNNPAELDDHDFLERNLLCSPLIPSCFQESDVNTSLRPLPPDQGFPGAATITDTKTTVDSEVHSRVPATSTELRSIALTEYQLLRLTPAANISHGEPAATS